MAELCHIGCGSNPIGRIGHHCDLEVSAATARPDAIGHRVSCRVSLGLDDGDYGVVFVGWGVVWCGVGWGVCTAVCVRVVARVSARARTARPRAWRDVRARGCVRACARVACTSTR